ncbi:MAG: hypothetical protein ACI9RO_001993 [Alteromonas macleodii]|jgi:hypothetical protein
MQLHGFQICAKGPATRDMDDVRKLLTRINDHAQTTEISKNGLKEKVPLDELAWVRVLQKEYPTIDNV